MIDVTNVTVAVGGQTVLKDFTLTVNENQAVVLGGPSGGGKSTVLKCLLGLVVPDKGTIKIQGQVLDADSVWLLRRHVAYVAQEPDLGTTTVAAVLKYPFTFRANRSLLFQLDTIPQWLERLALPRTILTKQVTELSGGEKQRIALIGALLLDRPILLLDEVTSALDDQRRAVVIDLLADLQKTRLIVTHDNASFHFADDHVVLSPCE